MDPRSTDRGDDGGLRPAQLSKNESLEPGAVKVRRIEDPSVGCFNAAGGHRPPFAMMLFSENEPRMSSYEHRHYFSNTILFVSLLPFHVVLQK